MATFKLLGKPNRKLKQDSYRQFSIPAVKTCPGAGDCKKFCYTQHPGSSYSWKMVANKHNLNWQKTKMLEFVIDMDRELKAFRNRPVAIRIHDTGDFYNVKYLNKWLKVASLNPDIKVYAYTKSINYFLDSMRKMKYAFYLTRIKSPSICKVSVV